MDTRLMAKSVWNHQVSVFLSWPTCWQNELNNWISARIFCLEPGSSESRWGHRIRAFPHMLGQFRPEYGRRCRRWQLSRALWLISLLWRYYQKMACEN